MTWEAIAALQAVRWEGSLAELATGIAGVLARACKLAQLELGSGSTAVRVEIGGDPIEVPCREIDRLQHRVRSQEGWSGPGARMLMLPLHARNTSGYAVLWLATKTKPPLLDGEPLMTLQAVLGHLVAAQSLLARVASLSRTAHADNRRLRRDLQATLGLDAPTRSPAMRAVLERADAVARYDTTVLLTGPSGAGKEVLARRIHARSARAARAFVQVNCGALPEALAESELFGHERGAFTGAERQHQGVFERASGGTLLLDEVGDLSLPLQVKLLRVLQERSFTRVGGEVEVRTDARVIAATHRPLADLVRARTFREDLFYRLAVFPIEVPGLADRREDIPRLVDDLVHGIARRLGVDPPRVPPNIMKRLVTHDWRGNVRELANVLESAIITSRGTTLELPAGHLERARLDVARTRTDADTFEQATRRCIEAALSVADGRIYGPGGAAERLGLKPATLQSKMRKLGIRRQAFVGR